MSPAERAWLRACWVALNGGPALTGELAWCRPDWVAGLALAREARRLVGITVMWWHDAPLQALPARVGGPGGPLALSLQRVDQASVPRLQCAQITPLGGTARSVTGTVGALATDWYDANALYALTAGHVLGAQAQAAFDDPVRIEVPRGVAIDRARLAEWSTVLSGGRRSFGIDAGMARLSAAEAAQLLAQAPDLLPASVVVSTPEPGAALQLHRRDGSTLAAVQGREYLAQTVVTQLCQPSGAVDEVTLRIERLQSYRLDSPSEHGDSGGAVWDDQQRLVGLHCGFVDGAQAGAANAVYTRIDDVMQRFEVEPITRQSQQSPLLRRVRPRPALVNASPPPALVPVAAAPVAPVPVSDLQSVDTLARTLWAESRGEGAQGMEAVACVVLNRARRGGWWGSTVVEVCRTPWQFSCWNPGTSSLKALLAVTPADSAFRAAQAIATRAVAGQLSDITFGACHYHAVSVLPKWAVGKVPCLSLGQHRFYNNVL